MKAPPEKGRANDAVVALLADRLGIDVASITVVSGHRSPAKIVAVEGFTDEAIQKAFPRLPDDGTAFGMGASQKSFAEIWDNPKDDGYANLLRALRHACRLSLFRPRQH